MSHHPRPTTQGRHVEPIRQCAPLGAKREPLVQRWEELQRRCEHLDAELARLARERQELRRQRAQVRDQLWPKALRWRGRRRPAVDALELPLPVLPVRPRLAWGRALRAHALRILRDVGGVLSLVELHRLLHLRGVAVDSPHPAKALADALGHEHDVGRAVRVSRGCYRAA